MKRFLTLTLTAALSISLFAQSRNFSLGQSLDIQNSILKQLSKNYVDSVKFGEIINVGIEAMLAQLDPYTNYFPEELEEDVQMLTTGIYGGVGSYIKKRPGAGVLITEPYPDSPAVKAGLQPGDTIFCIEGKYVYDETSEQSSSRMKGQPGTEVHFKVIKGGTKDTTEVTVLRERIHMSNIQYAGMIRDSIGYVMITGFTDKMSEELRAAVLDLKGKGAKRLVLDLRGNGGGLMEEAIKMLAIFVPKGTMVVSSRGRIPEINREYKTADEPVDTLMPLMVMIDSGSASSSEIVAGALQDLDRATIAGKRSFGKGLIQSMRPVAYNGTMKLTTGKYYTPSGRCVQAIDYSRRNEDGSVAHVPDSLTNEFRTKNGRIVKDGGGITPDIVCEAQKYSRLSASLVYSDILGDYAIRYYIAHPSIAPVAEFALTDAEYEQFVAWAAEQEFDHRTGLKAEMDNLVKAAKYEGLYDDFKSDIDALLSKLDMDKASLLRAKKSEIKPLLEEEIAVKYYYRAGYTQVQLRTDVQLYAALDQWDGPAAR